jgi:hypothetical protein
MALKIISFIFVISLAFGITTPNQVKDAPFNVNDVINQVSPHHSQSHNSPSRVSDEGRFDQSLTPDLTGEFLIDTSIVYVPAASYQESPAIAFDGTNYLVVWEDNRSSGYSDIYGARVSTAGVVLDSAGIAISTAAYNQVSPSVAVGDSTYLIVWQDLRNGNNGIYGARLNQAGAVLDPNGIPISTALNHQESPSIAFDGTNYLVVWQDDPSGPYQYDIYGSRVNQAGTVLDPNGIAISTAAYYQESPAIAFDGTNYLVVWQDLRSVPYFDIYGARVDPNGTVLDSNGIAISTEANSQSSPTIAFDGTNYLVVWQDERSGRDIYGARVSQAGIVIDTSGIPISTSADYQVYPSIAFDGTNYLVVWEDCRNLDTSDIYGARVNQAGIVLDSNGIAISTAEGWQKSPSVAFDGTNYFVVREDIDIRPGIRYDIYGARVSQSGVVLDSAGIFIPTAAYSQNSPSVAFDGTNYFVVWNDDRSGSYSDIYGARVSTAGIILDPAGITVSTAANWQSSPSIAFDGTNYLVVWKDYRNNPDTSDIYGTRVSQGGVVLDPAGIAISPAAGYQLEPSIAFGGTNYLVVWIDYRSGSNYDIYGARVSAAGIVLDPAGIAISTAANEQYSPSVAFDGTNYFVVWDDDRNGSYSDIYGTRVSPDGTVLDTAGIAISTAGDYQEYPAIAFDGTNYLLVWQDWRSSGPSDIYGARVNQAGIVLDTNGIAISTAEYSQRYPAVAFDGTNYLVVWQDWRDYFYIYGVRVNTSGVVIDSFAVSIQPGDQYFPALAKGQENQLLVTYTGFVDFINHRPANTMRIWGKFSSDIGIEEENSKVKMQSAKLFEVYPNPAKTVMRVRIPWSVKEQADLKIFDVSGKLVKEIASATMLPRNDEKIEISLKGINPGIYFLQLGTEVRKFLVVK